MAHQVDFYVVSDGGDDAVARVACRIVEKAWQQGLQVYLLTDSAAATALMDDLLWTFKQGSFVPHEIVTQAAPLSDACPVLLGHGAEPQGKRSVQVNLHDDVPVFFSRFERVLEVIGDDDVQRASGRTRYAFYRDRGYPLEYHKVNA